MTEESAAFYVVATPIGNLGDITLRALEVLRRVPVIAAEDTRHARQLLSHYGIGARLVAAHEHNEARAADRLIGLLRAGESVAYVSDAGTPAVSDPGARLVFAVRAAGFAVIPLPGPCAAVAALSVAGLAEGPWTFRGFLPAKAAARRAQLQAIAALPETQIFYESPHRLAETLEAIGATLGDRRVVLAKELTKVFETVVAGSATDLMAWLAADGGRSRGEFILLVEGAGPPADDDGEGERVLEILVGGGLSVRQSADLAAAISGVPRKRLYERALALRAESATLADE